MADHIEDQREGRLEGIVRASRYDPGGQGKQFLGAAIECSDATVWVIDYEEQSPFHAFAGRLVVATGEPYEPEGQHLIGWDEGKALRHFRVFSIQAAEPKPDTELMEVGARYSLHGRFKRRPGDAGESSLSFVTDKGDAFVVVNDPAGANVEQSVEVWAYPVQLPPSVQQPPERYLWVICPCSAADLWAWRGRHR